MSKYAEDPRAGQKSKKSARSRATRPGERPDHRRSPRPDAIEGDRRGRPERGGPPGRGHRGASPRRTGERGEPSTAASSIPVAGRGRAGRARSGRPGPAGRGAQRRARPAGRRAQARLPDHPGAGRAQRRGVDAEPRVGLPDPPPPRGRRRRRGRGPRGRAPGVHPDAHGPARRRSPRPRASPPPWAAMGPIESDEARSSAAWPCSSTAPIGQVADVATPDQLTRAAAIVAEARRRLYALLAEEPSALDRPMPRRTRLTDLPDRPRPLGRGQARVARIAARSSIVVRGFTMQKRRTVSPRQEVGHREGEAVGQRPVAPGPVVGRAPSRPGGTAAPTASARSPARRGRARRMSSAPARVTVEADLDRVAVGVGAVGGQREPQRQAPGPAGEVVGVVARVPLAGLGRRSWSTSR